MEIAHESLLVGWERLEACLNNKDKRPARLRLRRVEATARLWRQEAGETRPALLRGAELRQAERLRKDLAEEVTAVTRGYVKASRKAANLRIVGNALISVIGLAVVVLAWIYVRPVSIRIKHS